MNRFPKFILNYSTYFFKLLTLFTSFFILNFSLAKPITLSLSGGALFSKVSSNTGFSGSFGFTYPFFPDLDINANIDYLNLNPHSGFATDLTLGVNIPVLKSLRIKLGAGVSYLHLKDTLYPFSFNCGLSYFLNKALSINLIDNMRYKPKVGLVTNQVALGISYTFGFSDKGLIEANNNGSLAYKHLKQKRDARMLMLRRSLCSTLLCDNSNKQIYAQDLKYVKKNRSMINSFLDLSNYNLNLVMKKNNKDGKNMAKSLIDAKSIQSYFINSRGFAKNKIKII